MIQGLCRRLRYKLSSTEHAQNRQYIDMILKSALHLSSLTENILLLRKVETTNLKLELEALDLSVIVRDVRALYCQTAAAKGVTLLTNGIFPKRISLNKAAITIILSSLVENGIKYCPSNTFVHLIGRIMDNTVIILEVANQGRSIPSAEKQRLFERYYRGQSAMATTKGSGLGLYAVGKLTELMGGEVRVQSAAGVGTRFQVIFPFTNLTA